MTKADIQLVRSLADKRGRTEHGLFVAEGEKLIGELRTSPSASARYSPWKGCFRAGSRTCRRTKWSGCRC